MGKLRLVEPKAEVSLLKTVCKHADSFSMRTLSSLKEEYFGYPAAAHAYAYIREYVADTQSIPTWEHVCSDIKNRRTVRKVLENFRNAPTFKNQQQASKGVDIVIGYYRARVLANVVNEASEHLEGDSVDIPKLCESLMSQLVAATLNKNEVPRYTMGVGNNTTKLVDDILSKKTPPAIATGIEAWDKVNQGIFRGTVFTIAATSGAGKSAVANHIAISMAKSGCRVGFVSLEMSEEEMYMRTLSNISNVPIQEFISSTPMKAATKSKVKKAYTAYAKHLKKIGGCYTLYVPDEDMTGEELLQLMQPANYDVIFIDYLSLLRGTDGDDQWRVLGGIARYAKRYASANNCVVVLLAQLSEDTGKIRYARAVREHSGVMWTWNYEPENREEQILNIIPQKARNQSMAPFRLRENYRYMRVETYLEDDDLEDGVEGDSYDDLNSELDDLNSELL